MRAHGQHALVLRGEVGAHEDADQPGLGRTALGSTGIGIGRSLGVGGLCIGRSLGGGTRLGCRVVTIPADPVAGTPLVIPVGARPVG